MKITVTTSSDLIFVLEVAEDLELENFKAFCEVESGIPSAQIGVAHNGQLLMDNKRALKDYGMRDGDVVVIDSMPQGSAGGAGGATAGAAGECAIFERPQTKETRFESFRALVVYIFLLRFSWTCVVSVSVATSAKFFSHDHCECSRPPTRLRL